MATLSNYLQDWSDFNSSLATINSTVIVPLICGSTNSTLTTNPTPNSILKHFLKLVYLIGIVGNATAIIVLRMGERRVRNRKHLLLLTSLAANDFVALVGMLATCMVSEAIPSLNNSHLVCVARVVLRVFGIGSVCIAVTMAMERYLALTRPFLYQKQVTYYVISTALLLSWSLSAVLTCAPLAGFGVYYDAECGKCLRYKQAKTASDFVYGWVYVAFGTLLCVILVYCNLAVIQALYAISTPKSGTDPVVIRVSKSSCRLRSEKHNGVTYNAATAEEVAFSRLMATLSVLFIICWMPQIITSSLYLGLGHTYWKRLDPLSKVADVLLLMNYVVDPILYVLMRRSRFSVDNICRSVANCFKKKSHRSSAESIKTSCCPQETLLSDSGAELRPLRTSNVPTGALVKIHD